MIHLDSVNDTFGGQHQKQYGYELYFLLNYDNQLNHKVCFMIMYLATNIGKKLEQPTN